jgi:hypothetical protein
MVDCSVLDPDPMDPQLNGLLNPLNPDPCCFYQRFVEI